MTICWNNPPRALQSLPTPLPSIVRSPQRYTRKHKTRWTRTQTHVITIKYYVIIIQLWFIREHCRQRRLECNRTSRIIFWCRWGKKNKYVFLFYFPFFSSSAFYFIISPAMFASYTRAQHNTHDRRKRVLRTESTLEFDVRHNRLCVCVCKQNGSTPNKVDRSARYLVTLSHTSIILDIFIT